VNNKELVDVFNQPIKLESKLLVPLGGRLRVCDVVKLNKNTIIVKEEKYTNGKIYRVKPEDTLLLTGLDLMCHVLRNTR